MQTRHAELKIELQSALITMRAIQICRTVATIDLIHNEWSIVGYGTGAFWDLWNWCIALCLNDWANLVPRTEAKIDHALTAVQAAYTELKLQWHITLMTMQNRYVEL